jgi:nucleoside-diphosphate-sugar epimerase
LDRVIYAFGQTEGLRFTLFRPFNWIGPNLDNVDAPKEGSSRVLTQFLHNILYGEPIKLVDGGSQRRCFTYISDGIEALMKMLVNENKSADGRIFNVGNPNNDYSIKELAEKLLSAVSRYPGYEAVAARTKIIPVQSDNYYGRGYQDIMSRKPSVEQARTHLGWAPRVSMDDAITKTLDFYLKDRNPAMATPAV